MLLDRNFQKRVNEFLVNQGLLPREIKEAELYLYGLAFILLFFTHLDLAAELLGLIAFEAESETRRKGGILFSVLALLVAAPVLVYIGLTRTRIGAFKKWCIQFFYTVINFGIALSLANHAMESGEISSYIWAFWSTAQGLLLLLFSGVEAVGDLIPVPSRQSRRNEIVLATLIVLGTVIFGLLSGWFWAVTFSAITFIWRVVGKAFSLHPPIENFLINSPIVGRRSISARRNRGRDYRG